MFTESSPSVTWTKVSSPAPSRPCKWPSLCEIRALTPLARNSPITTTYPASEYWGIDQTVVYGSQTILPFSSGVVDTGTTLVLLASGKSPTQILDPVSSLTNFAQTPLRPIKRPLVRLKTKRPDSSPSRTSNSTGWRISTSSLATKSMPSSQTPKFGRYVFVYYTTSCCLCNFCSVF